MSKSNQIAFQINIEDNVATALGRLEQGSVILRGDTTETTIVANTSVPEGHKVALSDIQVGEAIIKYHVTIGCATKHIKKGSWVHLHNMESVYDERSSHLDITTGTPKDIVYE